jgi:hypothetical protein
MNPISAPPSEPQARIAFVAVVGSEIDSSLIIPFTIGTATITPTVAARQRQALITIGKVEMSAFHVGDVWEPVAMVTSPAAEDPDAPVEPGSVTFTFLSYKGVQTVGTSTKVSTGVWKSSIELTEAGIWKVSVESTAPYKASQPAQIGVKPAFDE